jgi:hypothetical protein
MAATPVLVQVRVWAWVWRGVRGRGEGGGHGRWLVREEYVLVGLITECEKV